MQQAKSQLQAKIDQAQKQGVKVVHDQDTQETADNSNIDQKEAAIKQDYQKQSQQVDQAIQTQQANEKTNDEAYDKAQQTVDQVNSNHDQAEQKLKSAVQDAAKVDGVTIVKNADSVTQTDQDKAQQDAQRVEQNYQAQLNNLNTQIAQQKQALQTYQTQLAAYNQKRQAFIDNLKKEGLWQDGTVDPTKLAQHLVLNSEPNAQVNAQLLQQVGTINGNQLQITDQSPVNTDFLRLTYTNLSNSSYADKKISKIVINFSDKKNSDSGAFITWTNDPTYGYIYSGFSGVTANMHFYDANGQEITFTNEQPAYITVGSLNNYSKTGEHNGSVEKAKLISFGEAISIPESSVKVHDGNVLYADKDNNFPAYTDTIYCTPEQKAQYESIGDQEWGKDIRQKYEDWDDPNVQPTKIFGAGLYKVVGQGIQIRSFKNNDEQSNTDDNHVRFNYSTTVPSTSFDAQGPKKPTLTFHWHDDKLNLAAKKAVTPQEVHYHFTNLSVTLEKVPDTPVQKHAQVKYHNVILTLDPYVLPDKEQPVNITINKNKKIINNYGNTTSVPENTVPIETSNIPQKENKTPQDTDQDVSAKPTDTTKQVAEQLTPLLSKKPVAKVNKKADAFPITKPVTIAAPTTPSSSNATSVTTPNNDSTVSEVLPQTGDAPELLATLSGLGILGLAGSLLTKLQKKNKN